MGGLVTGVVELSRLEDGTGVEVAKMLVKRACGLYVLRAGFDVVY